MVRLDTAIESDPIGALISILLYAMILHFRWIPRLANPFVQATGSFLAIWSIVMTYFGVNYLLMGMHSYAAGDKVAAGSTTTVQVGGEAGGREVAPLAVLLHGLEHDPVEVAA